MGPGDSQSGKYADCWSFRADGWSTSEFDMAGDPNGMKAKVLSIVKAVRLVMMCECPRMIRGSVFA